MVYCTQCAHEFQAGLITCPDCQRPLVERSPRLTAAIVPDDSWVEVGFMINEVQTGIARDALSASNIPNMVLSAQFANSNQSTSADAPAQTLYGQAVLVPREFRDDAEAILDAVLGEGFVDDEDE